MNSQNAEPTSLKPIQKSGIRSALEYTGIPASWLSKRPKLPSRNWLIFISVSSSITGLYIYDRQQCKRIRQEYVDRVKHFADEPIDSLGWPRKVTVYGSKWPGDEEYDQSLKYFRKYVKPILVSAAVDFEMITGKRHGELTTRIAKDIQSRRRLDAGLDPPPEILMALPTHRQPEDKRKHELDGGIVIIGRPTFKEFMAGLKKGWTDGLEKVDQDEVLARELEFDGRFDEAEEPADAQTEFDSPPSRLPSSQNSPVFSPLQMRPSSTPSHTPFQESSVPSSMNAPPPTIPTLPPLLLVTFTNYIGFTQIPIMIWEFFNQRHKVRSGAEAGYRLVMKHSRPINPPSYEPEPLFADITPPKATSDQGDLDFDKHVESYYKNSLSSIPADIEKGRRKYYEALPAKLEIARALARGTREPTKEEREHPPPTEVELRAERMKKERRWRSDLEGWEIVKPAQKVVWDDRFNDALHVFVDPPPGEVDVDFSGDGTPSQGSQ